MTFFEQSQLVLISVLLSVLANRLLVFLKDSKAKKNNIKKARISMPLFAKGIKNAIINNNYAVPEDCYKLLLGCYDSFSKDKQLTAIFEKLLSYYEFLKNNGYLSSEYRKEMDIKEIDKIIKEISD